jgi:hypothetical protein
VDNKTSLVMGFLFYSLSKQTIEQIIHDVEISKHTNTDAYISEMYKVLLEALYKELNNKES